jgi:hypothetical protein
MYPMQAIARRGARSKRVIIPTSVQNTVPETSCKITGDAKTKCSFDDSDLNQNSEVVGIFQSRETDSHISSSSSSSSSSQGNPTVHSGVDSTIDNSGGSRDPLLKKPEQHNSRNTKMFVSSQIHSGEVTMKHILFTFSKDPFEKIRYVIST